MSDSVFIVLIFCITAMVITAIVALVVYNRDKVNMKMKAQANIIDKIQTDIDIEVKDNKNNSHNKK